jgi:hypothetical protein
MYDQIRIKELELQMLNVENDRLRQASELKRFCIDIARYTAKSSDAKSIVSEASIIYDFVK